MPDSSPPSGGEHATVGRKASMAINTVLAISHFDASVYHAGGDLNSRTALCGPQSRVGGRVAGTAPGPEPRGRFLPSRHGAS